jgi:phosphoribosylamine--glycine ligase
MNVLIIGSGGREHALCWKLKQSKKLTRLYAAPGSDAIKNLAECADIDIKNFKAVSGFCKSNKIALVIVGPEAPLAGGICDALIADGIKVFGPCKKGAQIESSKVFAKKLMQKYSIPTAGFTVLTHPNAALEEIEKMKLPIVLKADGLASGKGVRICQTQAEAAQTVKDYMQNKIFAEAGTMIVAEEFLIGREVSVMAVVDGDSYVLLPASRDHKPLLDGNKGPNTGGMGAYSNLPDLTQDILDKIKTEVFDKLMAGFAKENIDYCGIVYAGLMLTDEGPKVVEFNCRLGDPETQVILPILKTDLLEIIIAACERNIKNIKIETFAGSCVCVVLSSEGYPLASVKGKEIIGLDEVSKYPDIMVFHAGTKKQNGDWITSGGRVLGVTALAADIKSARQKAYEAVSKIHFEGIHYRKDIGLV